MKKAVVICMLLLYGSATIGATIHMHYCMNKLVGASLWDNRKEVCTNCGMHKTASQGCCHDECKQVKLQADHQLTDIADIPQVFFKTAVTVPFIYHIVSKPPPVIIVACVSNAPPGRLLQKLYLQNRAWLI